MNSHNISKSKSHAIFKHKRILKITYSKLALCMEKETKTPEILHVWSQLPGQRRTQPKPQVSLQHPSLPVILCIHTQALKVSSNRMPVSRLSALLQGAKCPFRAHQQLSGLTTSREPLQDFAPVRLTLIQEMRNCFGGVGRSRKGL